MAKWFNTSLDATESWDEQDLKHAYFCSPYWWIRVKLQPLCLCKGPLINIAKYHNLEGCCSIVDKASAYGTKGPGSQPGGGNNL